MDEINIDVVLASKFVHAAPISELTGVDLIVQGEDE
jgi:hypothetical protein